MITISGYAARESADGKKFFSLLLSGDLQMVLSEETGRYYVTKKATSISSTFDEPTCKSLVGTTLPGCITKVVCDPYSYVIKETGESITLNHRWVYSPSEAAVDEMVYEKAVVEDPFAL